MAYPFLYKYLLFIPESKYSKVERTYQHFEFYLNNKAICIQPVDNKYLYIDHQSLKCMS